MFIKRVLFSPHFIKGVFESFKELTIATHVKLIRTNKWEEAHHRIAYWRDIDITSQDTECGKQTIRPGDWGTDPNLSIVSSHYLTSAIYEETVGRFDESLSIEKNYKPSDDFIKNVFSHGSGVQRLVGLIDLSLQYSDEQVTFNWLFPDQGIHSTFLHRGFPYLIRKIYEYGIIIDGLSTNRQEWLEQYSHEYLTSKFESKRLLANRLLEMET